MLIEDLMVIVATAICFLAGVLIVALVYRNRHKELPPASPQEIELQLEKELEKVNKEIENLQEGE